MESHSWQKASWVNCWRKNCVAVWTDSFCGGIIFLSGQTVGSGRLKRCGGNKKRFLNFWKARSQSTWRFHPGITWQKSWKESQRWGSEENILPKGWPQPNRQGGLTAFSLDLIVFLLPISHGLCVGDGAREEASVWKKSRRRRPERLQDYFQHNKLAAPSKWIYSDHGSKSILLLLWLRSAWFSSLLGDLREHPFEGKTEFLPFPLRHWKLRSSTAWRHVL